MTADAVVGEATFGVERSAASRARSFLQVDLGCLGVAAEAIDTTVLLASELITNAVLHARTDLVLRYVLHAYCVRIEVLDGNSILPTPIAAPLDATSGRGLALVESLANNWGIERTPQGKTVWFELRLQPIAA